MRFSVFMPLALVAGSILGGCGGSDSRAVRRSVSEVSEGAQLDSLGAITALPCAARIDADQDPDDIAPGLATSRLHAAFKTRREGSRSVSRADLVERDLSGAMATFYRHWMPHPEEGDGEPLQRIASRLQADAVLVAAVLKWKQTDNYTRVGMVAGLFDGRSGKMLWWSEQERQATASAEQGGPPDFVVVVDLVVEALLQSFPANAMK